MAGFFDDLDREDKKAYKRTVVYFVAASSLVMLLFLTIIYVNTRDKQARERALARQEQEAKEAAEAELEQQRLEDEALGVGEHNMTSEDLDFWDMYKEKEENRDYMEETVSADKPKEVPKEDKTVSGNRNDGDNEDNIMLTDEEKEDMEKAGDGKHIKAKAKGEDAKWYDIEEDAPKNTYDFKAALSMDDTKLEYKYGTISTRRGVDVSKYQGDIDWNKVKAAG